MIGIESLVSLVMYVVVVGLIFWLLHWLVNYLNPPEPFKKVATVILVVFGVLILIGILMSLMGTPLVRWS